MGIKKSSKKVRFADAKIKRAWESVIATDSDLAKQLTNARNDLLENAFCGRAVRKRMIPKVFLKQFGIENLWIYDLPSGWRLLYTITSRNKIEIITVVLDWMSHKAYERLFGF